MFIAHDLSVIAQICSKIGVMYLGNIVEITDRNTLFSNPQHPYTKALLSSIPMPNPKSRKKIIFLLKEIFLVHQTHHQVVNFIPDVLLQKKYVLKKYLI